MKAATLVWADEMRVGLLGQVRRVWAPRGVKVCQKVELKHEWAYLNLAVNGLTGSLYWEWTPNMKRDATAEVVKGWKKRGVEVIVWDGAPSHRAQKVEEIGVTLIKLPPYSPELNPAERVFEELRQRVEGQVYGSIERKKEAVEDELQQLVLNPGRVRSLAGWDWLREAVAQGTSPETESPVLVLPVSHSFSERCAIFPERNTVFQ